MRVMYSSEKVSLIISFKAFVQAGDFELAFMTAVFPPAIAAVSTPRESITGKLNGLIIKETPYGTLYTFVIMLGKQCSPLK